MAPPVPTKEYLAANHSDRLVNVAIVFIILEVLFLLLFCLSRYRAGTLKAIDTYLMIPAFTANVGMVVIGLLFAKHGLGRHLQTLPGRQIVTLLKLQLSMSLIHVVASSFPKLAVLSFYLRVFTMRTYRYIAYFTASIIITTAIVHFGVQMAMCRPFAYNWNKAIIGGSCLNQYAFLRWIGISPIITDIMILTIPLPVIWKLQASRSAKIGLTITFLTGSIGIVTGIVRFVVVFLIPTSPNFDLSWEALNMIIWTIVEAGVYFIAACLPSLRPLFQPFIKSSGMQSFKSKMRWNEPRIVPNPRAGAIDLSYGPGTKSTAVVSGGAGFQKIQEPQWPESLHYKNASNKGLVTCYSDRNSEDSSAGRERQFEASRWGNAKIVVQKEFVISSEPVWNNESDDT